MFENFRYGRQPPPEPTSPIAFNVAGNEVGHHHHHHHESFSGSRSGQILWIRGLTRLQTQVGQFCSCFSLFKPISLFSISLLFYLSCHPDTWSHMILILFIVKTFNFCFFFVKKTIFFFLCYVYLNLINIVSFKGFFFQSIFELLFFFQKTLYI